MTTSDEQERYAELTVDEEYVVYDRENHDAWIAASATVSLGDAQ